MKQFRKAYVVMSGNYNLAPLLKYCDEIVYIADSENRILVDNWEQILDILSDFRPDVDVIVPVGTVLLSFVSGFLLAKLLVEDNPVILAIWKTIQYRGQWVGDYSFVKITKDDIHELTEKIFEY